MGLALSILLNFIFYDLKAMRDYASVLNGRELGAGM